MKISKLFILAIIALFIGACGSSNHSKTTKSTTSITDGMTSENRVNTSLLNQIRRLKGVSLQGGVPVFAKNTNSVLGTMEPLYIVDDYTVGNSFSSVRDLVNPVDVKSIKPLQGADASFYGSRGANGVIIIQTKT